MVSIILTIDKNILHFIKIKNPMENIFVSYYIQHIRSSI
ncbi:hypothetical protein ECDEC8D_3052 [Escherichia coli DEC8D]|nr:hypothetical protein ECDEC8D_3052 [Escherichia coli DEC8D]